KVQALPAAVQKDYLPPVAGYLGMNNVVLGRFNPAIFQPKWFSQHDLLAEAEVQAAESEEGESGGLVVTHRATVVNFESLQLDVQPDRWILSTSRVDWINDLGLIAASVFRLLPHT